jgi:hypothetical protein
MKRGGARRRSRASAPTAWRGGRRAASRRSGAIRRPRRAFAEAQDAVRQHPEVAGPARDDAPPRPRPRHRARPGAGRGGTCPRSWRRRARALLASRAFTRSNVPSMRPSRRAATDAGPPPRGRSRQAVKLAPSKSMSRQSAAADGREERRRERRTAHHPPSTSRRTVSSDKRRRVSSSRSKVSSRTKRKFGRVLELEPLHDGAADLAAVARQHLERVLRILAAERHDPGGRDLEVGRGAHLAHGDRQRVELGVVHLAARQHLDSRRRRSSPTRSWRWDGPEPGVGDRLEAMRPI